MRHIWRHALHTTADTYNVSELVSGIRAGSRTAIARSITLIESTLPEHRKQAREMFRMLSTGAQTMNSFRIGITGSPGVGKSSLIEKLGLHCIQNEGLKAIDPSSQKSGGSILGDKTRMVELSTLPEAFIRPTPTSGFLGGVSRSTYDTIELCERFDVIFVETVGVGQSELLVADMTDLFVLCVAPGAGDELQGMKRGITEVADVIAVNKSENPLTPEARRTLLEYKSALRYATSLHKVQNREVLPVSARTGEGIEGLWSHLKEIRKNSVETKELEAKRRDQKEKWLWNFAKSELLNRFESSKAALRYRDKVRSHDVTGASFEIVDGLLSEFFKAEFESK